ncbi:hypothetical protein Tco_0289247, partial [Tanacetum coccineum]
SAVQTYQELRAVGIVYGCWSRGFRGCLALQLKVYVGLKDDGQKMLVWRGWSKRCWSKTAYGLKDAGLKQLIER